MFSTFEELAAWLTNCIDGARSVFAVFKSLGEVSVVSTLPVGRKTIRTSLVATAVAFWYTIDKIQEPFAGVPPANVSQISATPNDNCTGV